jgi:O-6-methylguanine DNA methyltransferase
MGFKERVYRATKRIPKGKVFTYKMIALAIKNPGACRAVGNSLNKNCNKKIPCHRVIKSSGEAGNYSRGQKEKIKLLKNEGIKIKNNRIQNLKKVLTCLK